MRHIPLDAIPDLSDTQVIVFSRWDRSPDIIEDQVTYPIVTALLGAPKVKAIRGFSDFGYSLRLRHLPGRHRPLLGALARARVPEQDPAAPARGRAAPSSGPTPPASAGSTSTRSSTGPGQHDLAELRSLQDWYLRYQLQAVPGVAEVAAVGGFVKQYQVNVDPNRLLAYDIPLTQVIDAVRKGNNEVGGRLLEFAGAEYMVRGRGYVKSARRHRAASSSATDADDRHADPGAATSPRSTLGPDIRRGVADLDGEGDTVGGIVVMRQGENALAVIERVKAKLAELQPTLPEGVEIVTTYDRSALIHRAIDTLLHALREEMVIVSLVILDLPLARPVGDHPDRHHPGRRCFLAFIPLYFMGLTANIMSLAGIAISIGVLVDGAIVEVENAYKRLEEWIAGGRKGDFHAVRLQRAQGGRAVGLLLAAGDRGRVPARLHAGRPGGPALQAARLHEEPRHGDRGDARDHARPGAAHAVHAHGAVHASGRAALARLVERGRRSARYYPEERHPISRVLFAVYEPVCRFVLRHRAHRRSCAALLLVASTVPVYLRLGSEFMPPLNEGAFLYMPTALPGMSVTEAQRILQIQDRILRSFPEVERVFGKAGPRRHADRSRRRSRWSRRRSCSSPSPSGGTVQRWYSDWPRPLRWLFAHRTARAHHLRRAAATRWTRRCASPASRTSGRCRSRTASTCCRPACARRSASRSSGPT